MHVPALSTLPRFDPASGSNPFRWIVEAAALAREIRMAESEYGALIRRHDKRAAAPKGAHP